MNLNSVPVTRLLGIATLVIVTLAGWFLLVGPTVGRLGEVDQRMTEAQDRNSAMSLELAKLQAQAEELPATRSEADRLAEVFPPTADQPGFFAQVNRAAADAGIGADQITDISHGAPVVPGDAAAGAEGGPTEALPTTPADKTVALQPVTVTVSASFADLTAMLGNLESMRRTLFVTGVAVTEGSTEDGTVGRAPMTLTVTGVTFVAPPLEAPEVNQPSGQRNDAGATGTDQASG